MIASAAVRVFAIVLVATTLDGVVNPLVDALRGVRLFGGSTTWFFYTFIPPVVGIVLLWRARRVAAALRHPGHEMTTGVVAVGVALIGIWMLTFGTTEMVRATRGLLAFGHLPFTLAPSVTHSDVGQVVGALAQIAAGVLLLVRRNTIAARLA